MIFGTLLLILGAANEWQWPIDTSYGITSSFGEYRGPRFHMGLDFSTGGKEGMTIRPAREGRVYQVRAQRNGYGRVAYVQHADGLHTVYAHMAAFGPKISAALKDAGNDPESYFGTQALDVPLTHADVLGISGESGAGMPHLHFEVRKGSEEPIDPLSLPFPNANRGPDKVVLDGIWIMPLDADSRVNGGELPYLAEPGQAVIQAQGRIGVQVVAYIQGARQSRLGLRGVSISSSDSPIAEWKPRQISFDQYRNAGLIYDQCHSGNRPTRFAYSFDDRAAFLPLVSEYKQHQVITIKDESVPLQIDLMNLAGEQTTHRIQLEPRAPILAVKEETAFQPVQPTTLGIVPYRDALHLLSRNFDGTIQFPEKLVGLAQDKPHRFTPKPNESVEIVWRTENGALKRQFAGLPGKTPFKLALGNWWIEAGSDYTLPAQTAVLVPANAKIDADTLVYLSPVLRLGHEGYPAKSLQIGYRLDETDVDAREKAGLYAWNGDRWRHLKAARGDQFIADSPDYLTAFVVARDISPPVILKPRFHDYYSGRRIVIPLSENGSGIDADDITIQAGSESLEVEYDSDRRWLILPKNAPGAPWTVSVRDRAGNQVTSRHLRL